MRVALKLALSHWNAPGLLILQTEHEHRVMVVKVWLNVVTAEKSKLKRIFKKKKQQQEDSKVELM